MGSFDNPIKPVGEGSFDKIKTTPPDQPSLWEEFQELGFSPFAVERSALSGRLQVLTKGKEELNEHSEDTTFITDFLKDQIGKENLRLSQSLSENREYRDQIDANRERIKGLKKELEALSETHSTLVEEIVEKEFEERDALEGRIARLESEIYGIVHNKHQLLSEEWREVKSELAKSEKENFRDIYLLDQQGKEITRLKQLIAELKKPPGVIVESREEEIEARDQRIQELIALNKKLEKQAERVVIVPQKEEVEAAPVVEKSGQEIRALRRQTRELQEVIEEKEVSISDLEKERDKQERVLNRLKGQLKEAGEQFEKKVSELNGQVDAKTERIKGFERQNEKLRRRISQLEEDLNSSS